MKKSPDYAVAKHGRGRTFLHHDKEGFVTITSGECADNTLKVGKKGGFRPCRSTLFVHTSCVTSRAPCAHTVLNDCDARPRRESAYVLAPARQCAVARGGNLVVARMVSTTKMNSTTSWVILNAGSVCVGARAFSAGTRRKSWNYQDKEIQIQRQN
jgi:hypothetical protein